MRCWPGEAAAGRGRRLVLQALGDPLSLLVLVASFAAACTLAGWTSCLVAARAGNLEVRRQGRLRPDPRRHLDPFGTLAALLGGIGWPRPVAVPFRASRGQLLAITLTGPAVCLTTGAALLVGAGRLTGPLTAGTGVLQAGVSGGTGLGPGARVLLLAGLVHLFVGLLSLVPVSLVPVPPLDAGRLLFALSPKRGSWRTAQDYLVERNLGTAAVLLLILLPLGGALPPLLAVLSAVGRPLVAVLT